ncbi:hypothetical protein JW949_03070 [Candidatus Woesearchaeota archaeon]|nr:hypothetical protein [Candidatus Woesearchaeota archaeon]
MDEKEQVDEKQDSEEENKKDKIDEVKSGKFWAVMSYIGFLFIFPFSMKRDNKFALFHAGQGMILFISAIINWALLWALGWVLILKVVLYLAVLFLLFCFVKGIQNAVTGKYRRLPLIGDFIRFFHI